MNNQNLMPIEEVNSRRTREEHSKDSQRGGKASAKARRDKKLLKDCLDYLLESDVIDENGDTMSGAEAIAVKLFKKALDGDIRAFELIRDTTAQKQPDKILISDVEPAVIAEIENMVNEYFPDKKKEIEK